jgi:hypothetical protein
MTQSLNWEAMRCGPASHPWIDNPATESGEPVVSYFARMVKSIPYIFSSVAYVLVYYVEQKLLGRSQ